MSQRNVHDSGSNDGTSVMPLLQFFDQLWRLDHIIWGDEANAKRSSKVITVKEGKEIVRRLSKQTLALHGIDV